MRASVLVLVASCGFSAEVPAIDDGETFTVVDDTFDGTVTEGTLGDVVEPDGFVLGGLHARAYTGELVNPGEDFTKVLADADAATAVGEGYAQVPQNWTTSRPRGLGLSGNDFWTVIWDGEILLPKGNVTLEIDADDRALVEVLGDTRAVDVAIATMPLVVPEAGWYPIRAALSDGIVNARLALTIVQGQVRTPVDGARLRARVTERPGVIVYAFDGQGFVGPRGHAARPTIAETFGTGAPAYDLTTSIDRFSLRFAGQLRIDTAGAYEFAATVGADDGFRIWIDGKLVAQHWLGHPDVPVASVMLDAGWHSLLVDYADEIAGAEITVKMNGAAIDPSLLRPVVVHGNTFTFATTTPTPIADQSSTFLQLPLDGDALTVIDSVDYGFRIDGQDMSQLAVTLFDCSGNGKSLQLAAAPGYHYYPADTSCAGKTTNPPIAWSLRLTDTAAGGPGGVVRDYGLTALYHGGPKMPFAPVVIYTSTPRPTPGAQRIEKIEAIGSFDGASVEIAVRTGADEAALDAAPFEVVDAGEVIAASELVQYRVTLTTNGWVAPKLDRVEIVYVAAP